MTATDRNGKLVAEDTFFTRHFAEKYADFQRLTAVGGHYFLSPIPQEILDKHGPLFTVEVSRR